MVLASESSDGVSEEDWRVYNILCNRTSLEMERIDSEFDITQDITMNLQSDLAALQYKRDRLLTELQDMKSQLRNRDQRAMELQVETEQLREQAARQNATIASLRKRIQELEEHERNLSASRGRTDLAMQTLQRENRHHEEKAKELEKKIRCLELECNSEESMKEAQRKAMQDMVARLSLALGSEYSDTTMWSTEGLVQKAADLVQETGRLRSKSCTLADTLASVEVELKSCRDALERAVADRDSLQRQAASHLLELDRLRQEKESLEMQHRVAERELMDLREKLTLSNRSLGAATGNLAMNEATICQIRDDLKIKEEKVNRVQNELRHLLESLAILLSSPARFVESQENSIKERLREVLQENKDRLIQIENYKEKTAILSQQLNRQNEIQDQSNNRIRAMQDDNTTVEFRLQKVEADLAAAEISRDALRHDKNTFMSFLERLGRALHMEEITKEIGVDLHTESLLARAEQLARFENDKLIDKYWWTYGTFPRLRRERSFHELPLRDTSVLYQLQRRIRTLREQLQRRDVHLDLLRRKLSLQEDNTRVRSILETERDEANCRVKKSLKQIDRLQLQLSESRAHARDLKAQLSDAADFKIAALERGRKVEELQKRLVDSEMLRNRYNRKVTLLKDQVRTTSLSADQERSMHDHSHSLLRDELVLVKQTLVETQHRENSLLSFRTSVSQLLGLDLPVPDYEIISRLQKLVHAHRDFTLVSRRYDDPNLLGHSPPAGSRTPIRMGQSPARYDDSGFVDPPDFSIDDSDDINGVYNKRPVRIST